MQVLEQILPMYMGIVISHEIRIPIKQPLKMEQGFERCSHDPYPVELLQKSWLFNQPPLTYPPRNKGLIGLIKGNQWLINP